METSRSPKLHVLLIEDSADDVLLIADALRSGGYEPFCKRVETAPEMTLALAEKAWDLITADYRWPGFSALQAFQIYLQLGLDIPFIIVSGVISEEMAVSAMKAGVHDYINKGNLVRLAPAVTRELHEAETRRQHKRAEAALCAAHEELAAIHANAPVALLVVDEELRVQKVNDMAAQFAGRAVPELLGLQLGEAIGCLDALADARGCDQGPSCVQCSLRRATLDSVHTGTGHANIEQYLHVSQNGEAQKRWLLVSTACLQFDTRKKVLICAQDVTELKQAAAEIECQRDQLAQQAELINLAHDAIVTMDPNGVIRGWNRGAVEIYGWTAKEAQGQVAHDLLHTRNDISTRELDAKLAQNGRWDGELTQTTKDGRTCIMESRHILFRDRTGEAIATLEINRDITERKRAEQALQEASELRRLALEAAEMGAWEYRLDTGKFSCDARFRAMFGFATDEQIDYQQVTSRIHGEDRDARNEAVKQAIAGMNDGAYQTEYRVVWPDSSIHWIASHGRVYFEAAGSENKAVRFIGVIADITERKQAELQVLRLNHDLDHRLGELHAALGQRNVLFREVQHRVKNNLQVISSMLALEADRFEDGEVLKALQESRDRVRSMALIHEKFCHSGDLAQIDFREYVDSLATYFLNCYPSNLNAIHLSTDVDVKLDMNDAIPCGLIIQELLSNSMKHAFPDRTGEVRIEFHGSCGELKLCYQDNGIGLPPDLDLENPQSLGLQLMADLVSQLQGHLEYRYADGARFLLSFLSQRDRISLSHAEPRA